MSIITSSWGFPRAYPVLSQLHMLCLPFPLGVSSSHI
ncbi:hypothetical protein DBR06_SOUSAS3310024 [Sousa chinensis]|nr:hypothetical protein DBR06_SOUSAS3310024 [Sousa chinensis]